MQLNKEDKKSFQNIQLTESNKINLFEENNISKKFETILDNTTKDQKTCAATKDICSDLKNGADNLDNFNILIEEIKTSKEKTIKNFITKKRGRTRKGEKKEKDYKKGKYRKGSVAPKIFNSCKNNMHIFLMKTIKGIDELEFPTITNKDKSHEYWRKLNNKTLYELYCESIPKRIEGDNNITEIGVERIQKRKEIYEQNNKNKRILDSILGKRDNYILLKVINNGDFLKAYLTDEKKIVKYDEEFGKIKIDLNGFETYTDCFNSEYTKEQKEKYKNHVFDIINNKSKDRIKQN
jgi:5-hydroxyisourate hydrolase-like protein (transthyretin family)